MTNERPPIAISTNEFLKNLADSGLSSLDHVLSNAAQSNLENGQAVAQQLVQAKMLTPFQADALLRGQASALRKGNYEILDRLGAGGMGTVFKAKHTRMKRIVALKALSPEVAQSSKFTQRFQREVETIALLHHPNIVMAFDADEDEDGPFLAMEFVDGRDLSSEVVHNGPLSVADAVECIKQAASGLEYAHSHGIIHRDIKPGNLLREKAGIVKVADLGLARLNSPGGATDSNPSLTQAGGVLGTVDYMAPEQGLDSTTVDEKVDIYSLGCTLYFLLTGRPPYQAGSLVALLLKHRDAPIPSLTEMRPDAPARLDAIFKNMVAKTPAERTPSMSEVIRELEDLGRSNQLSNIRPSSSSPSAAGNQGSDALTFDFGEPIADNSTLSTGVVMSPTAAEIVIPPPSPAPADTRSVVLVETSRAQAGIIRSYLEKLGFTSIQVTGSGRETLKWIKNDPNTIVISAMHLSDMTGVQLALGILADPICRYVGFILATSELDSTEFADFPSNDRIVIMPKPFNIERLREAIASLQFDGN